MNPISNTAFYCCGVRMEDARKKRSVCQDDFAQRFMDDKGLKIFEPFRTEKMPNISNITRCRLIDDYLAAELCRHKEVTIITLGAGFDTRPYRLSGGCWLEIDEAQIVDFKNERLPIEECPNPLQRVSIDFSSEQLADKLAGLDQRGHTVFVIEGVFMYLEPEAIRNTINTIQKLFPRHVLYCDLMTKNFFDKFAQSIHTKLLASGSRFTDRPDNPEAIFTDHHYQQLACMPMFRRAAELGILWDELRIPGFVTALLLNVFLKDLAGYAVHQFVFDRDGS